MAAMSSLRHRRFESAVVLLVAGIAVTEACGQAATSGSRRELPAVEEHGVEAIAAGIRDSQERLFKIEGGIEIQYRLDVEQNDKAAFFLWRSGLDGILRIKWPLLYSLNEGELSGITVTNPDGTGGEKTEHRIRVANYDFEQQTSVGKSTSGKNGPSTGHIQNSRHMFSANTCFPLMVQCFEQANQYYVPGAPPETDYWLPTAIRRDLYQLADAEEVDGVLCQVLERKGQDRLWIAVDHGHVMCMREFARGAGGPIAMRFTSSDLRQVSPGVWLPYRSIQEVFGPTNPDKPLVSLTVKVQDVEVGSVPDESLLVTFDGDEDLVEDLIRGRAYHGYGRDEDPFDRALDRIDTGFLHGGRSDRRFILLSLTIASLLGLGIAYLWRMNAHKA